MRSAPLMCPNGSRSLNLCGSWISQDRDLARMHDRQASLFDIMERLFGAKRPQLFHMGPLLVDHVDPNGSTWRAQRPDRGPK